VLPLVIWATDLVSPSHFSSPIQASAGNQGRLYALFPVYHMPPTHVCSLCDTYMYSVYFFNNVVSLRLVSPDASAIFGSGRVHFLLRRGTELYQGGRQSV
jgi:hypothetical protein